MIGMRTSAIGRAFIEAFEGLFLHTYNDGTGVLTIGYGHTSAAGKPAVARGMVITQGQADNILSFDLSKVETTVSRLIARQLTQSQFDALVSFEFNTGDLAKSSIPARINAGNLDDAMAALLMYNHADGHVMSGLTRRRRGEKAMFSGLVQAALQIAEVPAASIATLTLKVSS